MFHDFNQRQMKFKYLSSIESSRSGTSLLRKVEWDPWEAETRAFCTATQSTPLPMIAAILVEIARLIGYYTALL